MADQNTNTPATGPDGWVLVPREPTEEMILAPLYGESCGSAFVERAYTLMLAAAPAAPAPVLAQAEPVAVQVKALEWEASARWASVGNLVVSTAQTRFGYYSIVTSPALNRFYVHFGGVLIAGSYGTEEEAKGCAQATYDRAIRSALTHTDASAIQPPHTGTKSCLGAPPSTPSREASRMAFKLVTSERFGTFIAINMPEHCDMIVVFADKHQHVPVWIGMPHQFYTRTAKRILDEHECETLTIAPYRNLDKVTISRAALDTTHPDHNGGRGE